MADNQYTRGDFQVFRATLTLHLGAPVEKDIAKDSTLEFDGQTVRGSGFSVDMPQIRSAINLGWFVLADNADPSPAPVRPAGIKVQPAQSVGRERGPSTEVKTVHDEERDLGSLKQVRSRGDGTVQREGRDPAKAPATPARAEVRTAGGRKVLKVDEDDAVPVARIKSAAKKDVVTVSAETASRLAQEVNRLDNSAVQRSVPINEGAKVTVKRSDEGPDVLDEILPQSSRVVGKVKPVAAASIEEDDSDMTPEEKEAARQEKEARLKEAKERAEAARAARLASVGADPNKPLPVKPEAVEQAPEPEVVAETASDPEPEGDVPDAARMSLVRDAIPEFEWDMSRPRAERIEMALLIDDPLFLNGILAVEVPEVKAQIKLGLAAR